VNNDRLSYYRRLARAGNKGAQRVVDAFSPDQPRDPDGRWAGGSPAEKAKNWAKEHEEAAAAHEEAKKAYGAARTHHMATLQNSSLGDPGEAFQASLKASAAWQETRNRLEAAIIGLQIATSGKMGIEP